MSLAPLPSSPTVVYLPPCPHGSHLHCLPPHLPSAQCRVSTVQYSTVQYNTVQYSTVHYRTLQYSTTGLGGRNPHGAPPPQLQGEGGPLPGEEGTLLHPLLQPAPHLDCQCHSRTVRCVDTFYHHLHNILKVAVISRTAAQSMAKLSLLDPRGSQ